MNTLKRFVAWLRCRLFGHAFRKCLGGHIRFDRRWLHVAGQEDYRPDPSDYEWICARCGLVQPFGAGIAGVVDEGPDVSTLRGVKRSAPPWKKLS